MIDEHWDLSAAARDLFHRTGRPPGDLFALTPRELVAVFQKPAPAPGPNPVRDLHAINHAKPAGTPPTVPSWLMPKVPRRGRPTNPTR